jgi:hypothetical protein
VGRDQGLLGFHGANLPIRPRPVNQENSANVDAFHHGSAEGRGLRPSRHDEDTTPVAGWAGWDHLQIAQALSGLYQRRKTDDGWTKERLLPLLAGIDERVPWLLQWHNESSAEFGGMKLGEFFRDFVAGEAHGLGVAVADLRKWTPPAAAKRTAIDPADVLTALRSWKPEVDEDAEAPEGPTQADLAIEVGASKALVKKVLKKLESDGLVEKLEGRPARYVAIGEGA